MHKKHVSNAVVGSKFFLAVSRPGTSREHREASFAGREYNGDGGLLSFIDNCSIENLS